MAQTRIISDWAGGLNNSKTAWELAENESPNVQGFIGEDGALVSISGPLVLNSTEIVSGKPICGHTVFYKTGHYANEGITTTEGWTVAKCGGAVWLDISGSDDFRPIAARTEGDEFFAPMNGRLYMSNGVDANMRWDGNFYSVGTAACAGGTTAVTGTTTAWSTWSTSPKDSLALGDTMFFKIAGVWSQTAYTIVVIGGNGSITLSANGPNTGGAVPYMIVRTQLMGINAGSPPSAPTDGGDTDATGDMAPGTYYYKVADYNSTTGFEGEPSDASVAMVVGIGDITDSELLDGGTGYTDENTYPVVGGSGHGATFEVEADSYGTVTLATLVNAGTGYLEGDELTLSGSGAALGYGLQGYVGAIENGVVLSISLSSGGTGYSDEDVLTLGGVGTGCTVKVYDADADGVVDGFEILTGGTGYEVATGVATTGGGDNNCLFDIDVIANGVLKTFIVSGNNRGRLYRKGDIASITSEAGWVSSGAKLLIETVNASGGVLTVSIYEGGSLYAVNGAKRTTTCSSGTCTILVVSSSGGNDTQTLEGLSGIPADYQVDERRIYRTYHDASVAGPYYYVDKITRTGTLYTFADTYVDEKADSELGAELDTPGSHGTMPILKFMYQHGGRMYGFGNPTYPNRLYFSTINAAEWFPEYVFGTSEASTNSLGGYVNIGDGIAEEIVVIVPEGGAYIQSGEIGGDLLVFTTNKANRWHGSDWSDFSRTDAFGIGCTATRTALNCSGTIVWLSSDGIKAVQSGSNQPVTISKKLKADIPDDLSTGYVGYAAAAYWREWYVISVPLGSSTINNKTYFLHLPSGTVYEGNDNASSYCVWNGPGDNGQLYYGSTTVGKLYQYKPTTYLSAAAEWTSKLFDFGDSPNSIYMPFHVRKIIMCWVAPATAQEYDLDIYSNGDTGTMLKHYGSQAVTAASSSVTGRRYVVVDPSINARSIQLKVSGTFSAEMVLEWVRIEYQREGVQPGTKVGS